MAAKRRRDRSHVCVNTQRDYLGAAGKQDKWRGKGRKIQIFKCSHSTELETFLFQLFNLFMENQHTELQPRFHTAHEAGVLYFHFHFPTSSQQDFPSSSSSHTWPELQSGLQPFPRISLGWMLGLFAGKHSCRSSLGSAASLKDDIGSSWCLL